MDRLHPTADDPVEHPSRTATDEQTKSEVVEQARRIVVIAALQNATAGFTFMSCKDRDAPPYQGAVYMDFAVPADGSPDAYFRSIAAAMVAHGWGERPPPNEHLFGKMLSKDGVTAILYRDSDSEKHGIARIYGQCNDTNDHRRDATTWVDITDQLH